MKRILITLCLGIIIGVAGLAAVLATQAPKLMLHEHPSRYGLDETVARITAAASNEQWTVASVMELDKSITKHGGAQVRPVRLIKLCEAHHASRILAEDANRPVSVLMPCTIAVYEKTDGTVHIANMNAGLLGRLFGPTVAAVMSGPVAGSQQRFIAAATQ